jgi:hypothetical protein
VQKRLKRKGLPKRETRESSELIEKKGVKRNEDFERLKSAEVAEEKEIRQGGRLQKGLGSALEEGISAT